MKSTRFILAGSAALLAAACASQPKPAESAASSDTMENSSVAVTEPSVGDPTRTSDVSGQRAAATTTTPAPADDSAAARASTVGTPPRSTTTDSDRIGDRVPGSDRTQGTQGTSAAGRSTTDGTASAGTANRDASQNASEHRADNTGRNERDRDDRNPTSGDQSNDPADLKITQAVRKALVGDKSLSTLAKNVKIITAGGKVTLRGPVKSDAERTAIQTAAQRVSGVTQVDNQLEVK